MVKYNTAFFASLETMFEILLKRFGKKIALTIFKEFMELNLTKAYSEILAKRLSGKGNFKKIVGERDKALGLKVEFEDFNEKSFAYRFLTDPFPNLKGLVKPEELDAGYLKFKIFYFLGKNWGYKTTKHFWKGDGQTEHIIYQTS